MLLLFFVKKNNIREWMLNTSLIPAWQRSCQQPWRLFACSSVFICSTNVSDCILYSYQDHSTFLVILVVHHQSQPSRHAPTSQELREVFVGEGSALKVIPETARIGRQARPSRFQQYNDYNLRHGFHRFLYIK